MIGLVITGPRTGVLVYVTQQVLSRSVLVYRWGSETVKMSPHAARPTTAATAKLTPKVNLLFMFVFLESLIPGFVWFMALEPRPEGQHESSRLR